MPDAVQAGLVLRRGEDWRRTFLFTDDTGASLLTPGDALTLVLRTADGVDPALLDVPMLAANATGTGIDQLDAGTGGFRVTILAPALGGVPGAPTAAVSLAWSIKAAGADGLVRTLVVGPCTVLPEA